MSQTKTTQIIIDGNTLQPEQVSRFALAPLTQKFNLKFGSAPAVKNSRSYLENKIKSKGTFYGINTGFGALSKVKIASEDLEQLQYNLIRSHAVGTGQALSISLTKALMMLRANVLAKGYSGARPEVIAKIMTLLEHQIFPVIPEKGSVGACGDLAPLAHLALSLIGEGKVLYQNKVQSTQAVFKKLNLSPLQLREKEGLALINGTQLIASYACNILDEALHLLRVANMATALTIEGLKGSFKPFSPLVSGVRRHWGQALVAADIEFYSRNSDITASHANCGKVQDPYSLRCTPQVHGPLLDHLRYAYQIIQTEINSATDNPLIFADEDQIISGGNFHGEYPAQVLDLLALGIAELGSISERRTEKLLNPNFSGLPPFLTPNSGLNSGLMMVQVTAAALVSENKTLCFPASADSIPTSLDQEDHVSNGPWAGRKAYQIVDNLKQILAIEVLCGLQALSFEKQHKTSPRLQNLIKHFNFKPITQDRVFSEDMAQIVAVFNDAQFKSELEKNNKINWQALKKNSY